VAFNWIGPNGLQIAIADNDGSNPTVLDNTGGMDYPTWFPAATLAAMSTDPKKYSTSPCTVWLDTGGTILQSTLAGASLWADMPSVNQASPNLLAFAGQNVKSGETYDQDFNYIWTMDLSQGSQSAAPLEYGCPSSGTFDKAFQGRAPWWSPDGTWIIFESNRASAAGLYSIYLYEVGTKGPAIQVTDPIYNMNHAKWFPSGFPGTVDPDGCPS
jgi:Tol biopolymer transport system component